MTKKSYFFSYCSESEYVLNFSSVQFNFLRFDRSYISANQTLVFLNNDKQPQNLSLII